MGKLLNLSNSVWNFDVSIWSFACRRENTSQTTNQFSGVRISSCDVIGIPWFNNSYRNFLQLLTWRTRKEYLSLLGVFKLVISGVLNWRTLWTGGTFSVHFMVYVTNVRDVSLLFITMDHWALSLLRFSEGHSFSSFTLVAWWT